MKDHEITVSNEVYKKLGDFIETLNKKDHRSRSWNDRILEWLRMQHTKAYENLYRHIVNSTLLIEKNYPKTIILDHYTYKLLILYMCKNLLRSLNDALKLLVEETKLYYLEEDCDDLEILIRIKEEHMKLALEESQ